MSRLRVIAALACGLALCAGILHVFRIGEMERAERQLEMEQSRVEGEVGALHNGPRARALYGETDLHCPLGRCDGSPRAKTTAPLLEPTAR